MHGGGNEGRLTCCVPCQLVQFTWDFRKLVVVRTSKRSKNAETLNLWNSMSTIMERRIEGDKDVVS